MGIPKTIDLDRRLPDHVETAKQLLSAEPDWVPGEFRDLRGLVYPAFRIEFAYTADGTTEQGTVLLDGLRAGNDEHLAAYRDGAGTLETVAPLETYDLQTGDGGRTILLGHQCTNDVARAVVPKQLTYARNNSVINSVAPVRRTFDLPQAVTPESFEGVTGIDRLYLPFWIAIFDGEGGPFRIAIRPDEDGVPSPVQWLTEFVAARQSLIADCVLTDVASPRTGAAAAASAGTGESGDTAGDKTVAEAVSEGSESDEPATDADDHAPADDDSKIRQPDGVDTLRAESVVDPAPERGFGDVGGMDDLKGRLQSAVIDPVRNARQYEEYGLGAVSGVLLHGPPGCGKTHTAGALAGELGWNFAPVTPADLTSKYVGEPAEKVRDLFAIARANQPCVVFIDEIDAVAGPRDQQDSQSQQQLVNQLLTELEAVENEDVLVVAATNLLEEVDSAIRRSGRFDERIEVPPPDADARREIVRIHLEDRPVASSLSLDAVVTETAGFAASDVERLVNEAARIAMEDHAEITEEDLLAATDRIDTSIEEWVGRYEGLVEAASDRGAVVQPDDVEHFQAERVVDRTVDLSFADVGGMDDLKERLNEAVIDPIQRPDAYEEYDLGTVDGVLLHGPPGCGKTYVTRATAGELDRYFLEASPADLTSKYVGEPAEKVRDLFAIARANQPCVLLLDELDAVAGRRETAGTQSQQQLVNQLLTELEGLGDEDVVVIGTTNLIDDIDPAIRRSGRFDERVEVPPPDADARKAILQVHLESRPTAPEVDWDAVAAATEGFAASDIELLAEEAAREALRENQAVTTEVLCSVADSIQSSVDAWQRP